MENDLRLALFITGDVVPAPPSEFGEYFPTRHERVLPEEAQGGNLALRPAGAARSNQGVIVPKMFSRGTAP